MVIKRNRVLPRTIDGKNGCIDIHSGPFQPNPHTKFIYLLDPNGLKVQLVENI